MNVFHIFLIVILNLAAMEAKAVAAPSNDDCRKAYKLRNVKNYCSSPAEFTNRGATDDGYGPSSCFISPLDRINDVWFKFEAIGNIVNISVIGDIARGSKGTLTRPQVSLFSGNCDRFREVACHSDSGGDGIVETYGYGLTTGATYYIRVDGRGITMGSFQLCINNFNEVPSPSSDCSSGVVLCDKSSFTVPSIIGYGKRREPLPGTCLIQEESSAWYKFTCKDPGTLTLSLTPVNPSDDIDFVLFMLPNGVEDCDVKLPLRCVGSGENSGLPGSWSACTGSTGMKMSSTDISEDPGCDIDDDNFVAGLNMTAGTSYALLVQNYHNTGNGFSVEFGGTGTFVGPKTWFKVSKLSIPTDTEMWARDVSEFSGGIVRWEWNFGEDATPAKSKKKGPHTIKYKTPGKKTISLTVETKNGCKVTANRTITVTKAPPPEPEPKTEPETVVNPAPPSVPATPKPTEKEEGEVVTQESTEKPTAKPKKQKPPIAPQQNLTADEEGEDRFSTESDDTFNGKTRKIKKYWRIKKVGVFYHPSDSFNIVLAHHEVLDEMIGLLKADPTTIAYVEGHTNNIPHNKYCQELSKKRTDAAYAYLVANGIEPERLFTKILGKSKPRDTNKSKYGRKRNQRVEIKILYPEDLKD